MSTSTNTNNNNNSNSNPSTSNYHYTDEELYLDSTSLLMLNNNPNPSSSNSHAVADAYYHPSTTADGRMMMSNSEHHPYHPDHHDGTSSMATFSCRESTINTFSTTLSAMDLGLMDEMIMGTSNSVPTMPTMADNDPHRYHGRYIPPPALAVTRHSPTHQTSSWYTENAAAAAAAPSPVPVSPSPSPLLYGDGLGLVRGRNSITDSERTIETVNLSAIHNSSSQPNMFLQPQQHAQQQQQQQQRGPYQPQTLQQQQQQQLYNSNRMGLESPFAAPPLPPTPPPQMPAGYPRTVSGHLPSSPQQQQQPQPQQVGGGGGPPDLLFVVDQLQRELRQLRLQVQVQQQQQQQHPQQPSTIATLPPHQRARRMTEPGAMPFFNSASASASPNTNINNKLDTTTVTNAARSSPAPQLPQPMPPLPKLATGAPLLSKTTTTTSANKFLQDYHVILGERTKTTILTDLYKNYLRNIFPKSDKFQLHDLYQLLTVGYKCHVGSEIPPGERVCFWVRHDPTDTTATATEIRYDKNDNAAFSLATDDKIKKDVKENRTSSARPGRERKRKTHQKASGKRTRRGDDDNDDDHHHHSDNSDNSGPGTGGGNNNNSRGPTGNSGSGDAGGGRSGTGGGSNNNNNNNNNQSSYGGGGSSQGKQRGNRPVDQVEHVEHEYVCCTSEEDGSSDHDGDDDDDASSYYDSDHDIHVGSPTVGGEWVFPEEASSSSHGGNTTDQLRRDSHLSHEKTPAVPNSQSHDVLLDSHKAAISAKLKTDEFPMKKEAPYCGPPAIQKETKTHATLGSDLGPTKPAYLKPANTAAGKTEDMNHNEDFFWFFLGDDGDWYPFEDCVVERLEATRRSGKLTVECRVGENDYSLNVHRLEQTNVRSGNCRPIAKATAHWWWRDEDKVWQAYNRQDALKLALADLSAVEKTVYLRRGETVYFVDLEKRVQRNVETNYERDIYQGLLGAAHKTDLDSKKASYSAPTVAAKGYESDDSLQEILPLAHPSYICPLSKKVMRQPVLTAAGSTYEYKHIVEYLKNHNDDPLTKRPLPSKALTENRGIRDTIGQWRDEMLAQKRYERPSDTTIEKLASVSSGWDSRRTTERPGQ